jgi:hypothetical protein
VALAVECDGREDEPMALTAAHIPTDQATAVCMACQGAISATSAPSHATLSPGAPLGISWHHGGRPVVPRSVTAG